MLKIGSKPIRALSIIGLVLVFSWIIWYVSTITSQHLEFTYLSVSPFVGIAGLILVISLGITRNSPKAYDANKKITRDSPKAYEVNKKLLSGVVTYFWFQILITVSFFILILGWFMWIYVKDILIKYHIILWQ